MKKILRILMWIGLIIVIGIGTAIIYVQLSYKKKFDAPYPQITASRDPAVIERGKYIAYGPAHCAICHVPMEKTRDVDNGLEIPLSGGWEETFPGLGTFRAPNLTPDPETGIGKFSDAEIARVVRYGVKPDGTFLAPFMAFQGMSDEDLTAVISFLRSQEPVKNKVEPTELSFLAKALVTFGLLKPQGPESTPPVSVPRDTTAVYGKYLANNVGNCNGCHVARDSQGKKSSPDFSGGGIFYPNSFSEGFGFVSPNLTPHKGTGVIAEWDQDMFVDRFRGGRQYPGSPMPWGLYSKLDESDLKALYQYLHSLDPVDHKIEKTVYKPGEKLPE
jgi:mono/diheme cytochrome c family protein